MNCVMVDVLVVCGYMIKLIDDFYMDFGLGQFVWCFDFDDLECGYVVVSDSWCDGLVVGF